MQEETSESDAVERLKEAINRLLLIDWLPEEEKSRILQATHSAEVEREEKHG